MGNSQVEKPWVIFFQSYLGSRQVAFYPSDPNATLAHSAGNSALFQDGSSGIGRQATAPLASASNRALACSCGAGTVWHGESIQQCLASREWLPLGP